MNTRKSKPSLLRLSIREWSFNLEVNPSTLCRWLEAAGYTNRKDGFTLLEVTRAITHNRSPHRRYGWKGFAYDIR